MTHGASFVLKYLLTKYFLLAQSFFSFSVSVCLCMFQASKDNLQCALEDYSLWSEGSESVTSVGMWFPVISGSGVLDL